jgi:hypothetical protein
MLSGGDCYQAAGVYLMDRAMFQGVEVTLVHGYPTLRRPPWKKYGHAWVEYEVDGQTMVKDIANGRDIEMPACLYYSLGNIDPAECRRYSYADLKRWVLELEHWGPWEKEPDGAL